VTQGATYGQAITVARPTMKGHQISFQNETQQPMKKVKHNTGTTSVGGVVARFFNTAANGYRIGRPAAVPQQVA